MSDQETVANMERVWSAIIALGATLTEREWKTPTDCPGWTVQDRACSGSPHRSTHRQT
jgi:hypothetical protein